jgi:hypothetical protein
MGWQQLILKVMSLELREVADFKGHKGCSLQCIIYVVGFTKGTKF